MMLSNWWIFDSSDFPARWECGDWPLWLGRLHIVSDLLIWSAYLTIPLLLVYLVLRRRDAPFPALFWLFGAFIITCGTSHLLDAIIFYEPLYRLAAFVKLITAVASWATVIALLTAVPKALAMVSPQDLEREVAIRTAELVRASAELQSEAADKFRAEQLLAQERERAEQARQASDARNRALFEYAPDGIVIADAESYYIDANASICRMLGYSRDELIGLHASDIVSPTENQHTGPALSVIKEKTDYCREWQFRRKDGSVFAAEVVATVMPDGNLMGMVREITERKLAEEAVRRSESRLRNLVEQAGDGFYVHAADGRIVDVNRRACESLGYFREELVGMGVTEIDPDVSAARFQQVFEELAAGQDVTLEGRRRRRDGTTFPVEVRLSPLETDGPPLCLALVRDITERRRAERAMAESEARKAAMLEASLDPIVTIDDEGNVVEFNTAAERTFGYARSEVVGREMCELIIPPQLRDAHRRGIAHYQATGEGPVMGKRIEITAVRADGTEFPVELAIAPISTGGPAFFTAHVRDITERRRQEWELEGQRRQFHTLAESIPQLCWMAGPDGHIFWYNRRWYDYTGTTFEQVQGWGWQSVHDPDLLPEVMERWKASVATGQPFEMEFPLRQTDGRFRWFLTRAFPLKDAAGCVVRWFGTNTDISEKREAEEVIRQLNEELEQRVVERTKQLEQANQELESFSYSVSHDLRAPLRSVDGFSRILLSEYAEALPDEARSYLLDVRANAQRMGRLIDDLLTFSRLSRQPVKKQAIASVQLVRQCLDELRSQQEGRRVEISVDDLAPCRGDPSLLRQVWTNLLSNALKYTGKREVAVIEVGSRDGDSPGQQVYFVKDNGVGFDMRYAHKLFGVFQRLHRAEDYEGTGVGLAIVQRIVHRHGGRVWAEAELDRGAAFFFTLDGGGSDLD